MAIFLAKSIMEPRAVFFCKCRVLYNTDKCGMEGGILGCPVIGWIFITARRIGEVNLDERNGRWIEKQFSRDRGGWARLRWDVS